LIEKNGEILPIEIKLSSLARLDDFKGIFFLKKAGFPVGQKAIIAPARQAYSLGKGLLVIPPSLIG